jgi:hypothetical protein
MPAEYLNKKPEIMSKTEDSPYQQARRDELENYYYTKSVHPSSSI